MDGRRGRGLQAGIAGGLLDDCGRPLVHLRGITQHESGVAQQIEFARDAADGWRQEQAAERPDVTTRERMMHVTVV